MGPRQCQRDRRQRRATRLSAAVSNHAIGGARPPGATPTSIAGHRRSAVLLAGPKGTEQVRCWLADRGISPELPNALLDASGARLPDRLAADLDAVFAGIGAGRVAKASLSTRVE